MELTRKATYKDFPILTELFEEYLSLETVAGSSGIQKMQNILVDSFYNDRSICIIGEDEKRNIMGFCSAIITVDNDKLKLYIVGLFSKNFKVTGDIYREMLNLARKHKISEIFSFVKSDSRYSKSILKRFRMEPQYTLISREVGGT